MRSPSPSTARISRNGDGDANGPARTARVVARRACPFGLGEVNATERAGGALKAHAGFRRNERGGRARFHHPIDELPFAFVAGDRASPAHTMKACVYDDADRLTVTAHGHDAFMRIRCTRRAARDGERANRAERHDDRRGAAHPHSVRRARPVRKPRSESVSPTRREPARRGFRFAACHGVAEAPGPTADAGSAAVGTSRTSPI